MRVTQSGNVFAFSFDSVDDIATFNIWLDEVGHPHAKVAMPGNRQQRRLVTKGPSIFRALDDNAVTTIRARWFD